MSSWEERMSQRAKAREAEEIARLAAERKAALEALIEVYLDNMDLDEDDARYVLDTPVACACVGCPLPLADRQGAPCYCQLLALKAKRVLGIEP